MAYREFVSLIHKSTKRDYLARVTQRDKAEVAEMAVKFDYDYWDEPRDRLWRYKYDGRWRKVADAMIAAYGIKPGMRVLDVGSGKGFLLHDFWRPFRARGPGIDISAYGVEHAMETSRFCQVGNAAKLPWPDKHFDLVISIKTLHNLYNYDLEAALARDGARRPWCQISLRRSLSQRARKENLMYWQLTCRIFHTPGRMGLRVQETGYTGDHEFIFFE